MLTRGYNPGTLVGSLTLPRNGQRRRANIKEIRSLCTTLFIRSEGSYNGFWMRAICVCALRLGLSISVIGSSLSDSTGAYAEVMTSKNLLHWAVERHFADRWTTNSDRFTLALEESMRAELLKECFSQLLTTLSTTSLPELYKIYMHEMTDLTA